MRLGHALVENAPACQQMGQDCVPNLQCPNLKPGFPVVEGKLWAICLSNPTVPHEKWNVDATAHRNSEEGGRRGEGNQNRGCPERTSLTYSDVKLASVHPYGHGPCLPVENQWFPPTELVQRAAGD